jgi:hypothetical protein
MQMHVWRVCEFCKRTKKIYTPPFFYYWHWDMHLHLFPKVILLD